MLLILYYIALTGMCIEHIYALLEVKWLKLITLIPHLLTRVDEPALSIENTSEPQLHTGRGANTVK